MHDTQYRVFALLHKYVHESQINMTYEYIIWAYCI